MQDIYAFDVGDYGKLGLLHRLAKAGLNLGVVWWKTELGSPGNDGKHLSYLEDSRYRRCDPDLLKSIRERIQNGPRSIEALEALFPDGTSFFADVIPTDANCRLSWFDEALAAVRHADIVFCDPDNGIGFTASSRSQRHVSLSEVRRLYDAGPSIVVYHHLNRSCGHAEQIRNGANQLRQVVPCDSPIWTAHFRRGTSRVYFLLPQPQHCDAVATALKQLSQSHWCADGHFTVKRWFSHRS